ncbi:magnesium and cobalt transport protein CorA [Cellulosimicrobium terreum]|nr:magnesium and cobalt transport protein CorA [Cellulosimicrobium terreum]
MSPRRTEGARPHRIDLLRRSGAAPAAVPPPVARLTQYVVDGTATPGPTSATVAEALAFAQESPDHLAMLFYPAPTRADIDELAADWDLHPILVEDLVNAHQRPKLERYGDVMFVVARSARYIDELEEVDFAEFHILVGRRAVAVLCQDGRWIDGTSGADFDEDRAYLPDRRERTMLAEEELLRLGPEAVVYRLLDAIVDAYRPVIKGLTIDREQIERQVFSGDAAAAERIYRLSQEVIDVQQASTGLADVLHALREGFGKYDVPDELQAYLQDVSDHLTRIGSQSADLRDALAQILDVNATLVAQRQNSAMQKISGWAAILFAPTLIAAIYGMNFEVMPELHWTYGYLFAVILMVAFGLGLYVIFKIRRWM